jgi:hypothetical protein
LSDWKERPIYLLLNDKICGLPRRTLKTKKLKLEKSRQRKKLELGLRQSLIEVDKATPQQSDAKESHDEQRLAADDHPQFPM